MGRQFLLLAGVSILLLAVGTVAVQRLAPARAAVSAATPQAPSGPAVAPGASTPGAGWPGAATPGAVAEPPGPTVPPVAPPQPLLPYTGPVEHIFFHPLIAYPERAFDGDSSSQGYDDWFVTVPEFDKMLPALYDHGYMLVSMDALFADQTAADGTTSIVPKPLMLPEGKRPLILSIDDVNYYDYMRQNGNVHRLILEADGRVGTYSLTPTGQERISYDNEIIPILDNFVAAHPDFSLNGAKGLIAVTGYEGILGYRTNEPASASYTQDRSSALRLVQRLKETGWSFASHSWGHLPMANVSYNTFVRDTDRWKAEVEPLIGPTPVYIYPHGSMPPMADPKTAYLLKNGFRILCTVGPTPYQPEAGPGRYALMERRHIDGMALRTQGRMLRHLFDAAAIIDPVRPKR